MGKDWVYRCGFGSAGIDIAFHAAQLHRSTADAAENLFGKRADDAAVQAGNGPLAPQLLHLLERFRVMMGSWVFGTMIHLSLGRVTIFLDL